MSKLILPDAPPTLTGPVKAWSQPVIIPTYLPMPPDKNPMFLEKRVYQGSSGRVYPLPMIDRISTHKTDHTWQAIHIENQYLRLMILPELGGRIHLALDKTNNYDIFYRQNVIKPALVGLAGPWISGGIEFNWPQHHRPSTFMPVDTYIENHDDGSVTVWCSEHDPMTRMQGTHGIHLKPGSSLIEVKVRLYNRTELPQTFLWWANAAARVHEHYQSFFPPDAQFVADHAKRAMSRFPLCEGTYYGIDYAARAAQQTQNGAATVRERPFPPDTRPDIHPHSGLGTKNSELHFPPSNYARNDLTWYANISVPTSYMILGTKENFFGGYDHRAQAGFVHVADPHISPGKKQWTWGNHPFGYAWDRNLTDPDEPGQPPAPYIELMAGVFTDNQPDFSYLMPGESRHFSQFWYPIQKIGPAQKASTAAALSLTLHQNQIRLGVAVTAPMKNARIRLHHSKTVIHETAIDLSPDKPFIMEVPLPQISSEGAVDSIDAVERVMELEDTIDVTIPDADAEKIQTADQALAYLNKTGASTLAGLRLTLLDSEHREILSYKSISTEQKNLPAPAKEPDLPENIKSLDELYLIGLHLEQYRHATRAPEPYWREALKRDPNDSRCNNALGLWHLRRGEFGKAVAHFQTAIATLTQYNPNPRDGEPYYNLGIALRYLNRLDEAYDAFGKATWNHAWQSPAYFAMAQIDCLRKRWNKGVGHLNKSLAMNARHSQASNLKVLAMRRSRQKREAEEVLSENIRFDSLDFMAKFLNSDDVPCDRHVRLDLAIECCRSGFYAEAADSLDDREWDRQSLAAINSLAEPTFMHSVSSAGAAGPLIGYYLGYLAEREGDTEAAVAARGAAIKAPPDYCFPHRLEEIAILIDAISKNPDDPRAPYYLGNLLYDKRRHQEAITWWEKAAKLDRAFPTVWRNLGIAYYNILCDPLAAKGAYQRAFQASLVHNINPHADPEDPLDHAGTGDARILYERDQLWKRTGSLPAERLAELESYPDLVQHRDDLTLETCALLNQLQRHDDALHILKHRHFQPWEGGEGLALAQWTRAHIALGRQALWRSPGDGGSPTKALELFTFGLNPPENLGEAFHPLQNNSELHYWAGTAAKTVNNTTLATEHFQTAAASVSDFQKMALAPYSENSLWSALALRELNRPADAQKIFDNLLAHSQTLKSTPAKIDYFATSLPTMLIFNEDIQKTQTDQATLLEALALWGGAATTGTPAQNKRTARRLLTDLLQANPSHPLAADLLIALDWQP